MAKEVNINKMRLCESIHKKHKEWNAYKKQCSLIQDALEMNKIYRKDWGMDDEDVPTEKMNIAPSQLKIVSEVDKLNVLKDILDMDLVESAEENYILISKSDDSVAMINFINKFGEKLKFQINVKKLLEVSND